MIRLQVLGTDANPVAWSSAIVAEPMFLHVKRGAIKQACFRRAFLFERLWRTSGPGGDLQHTQRMRAFRPVPMGMSCLPNPTSAALGLEQLTKTTAFSADGTNRAQ